MGLLATLVASPAQPQAADSAAAPAANLLAAFVGDYYCANATLGFPVGKFEVVILRGWLESAKLLRLSSRGINPRGAWEVDSMLLYGQANGNYHEYTHHHGTIPDHGCTSEHGCPTDTDADDSQVHDDSRTASGRRPSHDQDGPRGAFADSADSQWLGSGSLDHDGGLVLTGSASTPQGKVWLYRRSLRSNGSNSFYYLTEVKQHREAPYRVTEVYLCRRTGET